MTGMRAFSTAELSRMQTVQEGAMQDECIILTWSSVSSNQYGLPEQTWTEGEAVRCGFDPEAKGESMGETEVGEKLATVRLPIGEEVNLDVKHRIQITKRFGVTLTPQPVYDVVGLAERGPSGLVLRLRLVTDGSDA